MDGGIFPSDGFFPPRLARLRKSKVEGDSVWSRDLGEMGRLLTLILFVVARTVDCANTNSPSYVGCYTDSDDRQLKGHHQDTHLNTPDFCMGICHAKGFPLAGVQAANQCFCGETLKDGTKVDDRECESVCPGDDSVKCGGIWRISIYRTGITGKGFNPVKTNYLGCYEDNGNRLLNEELIKSDVLTPDYCVNHCQKKRYTHSGVEVGKECYCGNSLQGATKKNDEECNFDCDGDKSLKCGGAWRLSVYKTPVSGVGVDSVNSNYIGCYVDADNRQLPGALEHSQALTPDLCVSICYNKGFTLAGVEKSSECFCGDSLRDGTRVEDSECNHSCSGDSLLNCGGIWRISVYRTSALGRGFNPVSSNYIGCYSDSKDRQLNGAMRSAKLVTPDYCVRFCKKEGYRLAGLQNGQDCYCGDTLAESSQVEEGECNTGCTGDLSLKCGANWRLSVYTTSENIKNGPTQYVGCFEEFIEDRLFTGASIDSDHNSVDFCVGFCYRRGYLFAGMQYGEGCFCGNSLKQRGRAPKSECGIPCSGARYEKCGGNWRISIYTTGITLTVNNDVQLPSYMGCYKDSAERQLLGAKTTSPSLTPDLCSSFCYRKGFRLSGSEVGSECYCGDNLREGTVVADSECKSTCFGDGSIFCGWFWRLSVYRTSVPAHLRNSFYMGCFEDSKENKILIGDSTETDTMTIDYCVGFCYRRGYVYAGLQNGARCFCGNTLNQRNDRPLSQCDSVCAGDRTEFCGGNWKASIYNTGFKRVIRPDVSSCQKSKTTMNGQPSCRGEIFKEDFNSGIVDRLKWSYSRFMPSVPDNEFVVFGDGPQNIYVKDGILYIKPTLNADVNPEEGQLLIKDCTGKPGGVECLREAIYYVILPPVKSARIHTKESFSFRYGRVEVRAKLPVGDWIVPELWLVPKDSSYGANYASGKIRVAMARGNRILSSNGTNIGNDWLESGIVLANKDEVKIKNLQWPNKRGWHTDFHKFIFTWKPDGLSFSVDGGSEVSLMTVDEQRLSEQIDFREKPSIWNSGTNLAPFDKEFYISFGVSVGGIRDFPDECISDTKAKPWSDSEVKAVLNFWNSRDQWYPTWSGEDSALKVDYIKVTAL